MGTMEHTATEITHQPQGVNSSSSHTPTHYTTSSDPEHLDSDTVRQHSDSGLPQQDRRENNYTELNYESDMENLPTVQHNFSSTTHSRSNQHSSGHTVEDSDSKQLCREQVVTTDLQPHPQASQAHNGSVLQPTQQPTTEIRDMETRPSSNNNQRLQHPLGEPQRELLHQSPVRVTTTGSAEDSTRQSDRGSSVAGLEISSMVATSSGVTTTANSNNSKEDSSILRQQKQPTVIELGDDCSAFITKQCEGLSDTAKELLTDKNKKSTNRTYNTHWKHFSGFVKEKNIIIAAEEVEKKVVSTLVELIAEARKNNKKFGFINNIISAVSSTFKITHSINIAEHSQVQAAKKAFHNFTPPTARYNELFNTNSVFKYLRSLPENLNIEQLREKLILLLKLDLMWRDSDLERIYRSPMCMKQEKGKVSFRTVNSKEQRIQNGILSQWISVFATPDHPRICTVTTLNEYLQRTKSLTETGGDTEVQGKKTFGLLVSLETEIKQQVKSLSAQRIGKIALEGLTKAGINTKTYKSHSTRGASISKAIAMGVSQQRVMEHCKLATESTLKRHYKRAETPDTPFTGSIAMALRKDIDEEEDNSKNEEDLEYEKKEDRKNEEMEDIEDDDKED